MATHANSTPVPARPLLPSPGAFEAERLLPERRSGLDQRGAAPPRSAEFVCLDWRRPSPDAFYAACNEFHDLYQERQRIDARLAELLPVIDRRHAATLPQSRLTQAAPGVLLFKGGRNA